MLNRQLFYPTELYPHLGLVYSKERLNFVYLRLECPLTEHELRSIVHLANVEELGPDLNARLMHNPLSRRF